MKNTILSEKDTKLIEAIILRYGRIVSTTDLLSLFSSEYNLASSYNRIQFLAKTGWLKRIRNGLYIVNDSISGRFQNELSLIAISHALQPESYISLAYALYYHQMFDQLTKTVVAITSKESKKYLFDDYTMKFTKVKGDLFFGFEEKNESGYDVNVAEVEKAFIDYLYLDKSFSSASLVFEKLQAFKKDIDFKKLQQYASRIGITMVRKIGFLLDQLEMDTHKLYAGIHNNNMGFSKFTADSKRFNAKWRIYYDDKIIG